MAKGAIPPILTGYAPVCTRGGVTFKGEIGGNWLMSKWKKMRPRTEMEKKPNIC